MGQEWALGVDHRAWAIPAVLCGQNLEGERCSDIHHRENVLFEFGFNRVRFISPFLVDVPARATIRLLDVEDKGPGRFLLPSEITVNQEGSKKPNMIAELLAMIVCT